MTFKWPTIYRINAESATELFQGDIFELEYKSSFLRETTSYLMMANTTCDLVQKKLDYFLFAPVYPLSLIIRYFFQTTLEEKRNDPINKGKEIQPTDILAEISAKTQALIENKLQNFYFLPPYGSISEPHVAELQLLIPMNDIPANRSSLLGSRILSLECPSREFFGGLIGQFFGRVGLPPIMMFEDIKELKKWTRENVSILTPK